MKRFYLTVLLALIWRLATSMPEAKDSTVVVTSAKRGHFTAISRVHTMGLFLYMGKVVNYNPATDLFLNYTTKRGWGFSAFKAVDINDIHSDNNFAFAFISKAFHLTNRLTITPYIGAGLEQQHQVVGHGSDAMLQLQGNYKLNKKLSVEYVGFISNLIFATEYKDWTNRIRVLYNSGHWDVIGMFWSNNAAFDGETYTSGGASVFYNRIAITDRLSLGAGITSLSTFQSTDAEAVPRKSGLQFSTTLTFR